MLMALFPFYEKYHKMEIELSGLPKTSTSTPMPEVKPPKDRGMQENSEQVPIKIKLLHQHSKMPDRKHPGDAGFDLYAADQYFVRSDEVILVKTGIAIELPFGYEAQVRGRSGLALKHGIFMVNGVGTIDAGYRGEIGVIVSRVGFGNDNYVIARGDAVAQLVIHRLPDIRLVEAKELSDSSRGINGYGSTGK